MTLALLFSGVCPAQERGLSSTGASDDCTETSVDFMDNPNLTRDEKKILMDRALLNSLNQYDRCHNTHDRPAAGGGGEAGGESGSQRSSTASAEMSGTRSPAVPQAAPPAQAGKHQAAANEPASQHAKGHALPGNGKIPADIPSADNDSVLEEQIRQAAMNETDPVIKAKLWNEYRRYKGLSVVKKP